MSLCIQLFFFSDGLSDVASQALSGKGKKGKGKGQESAEETSSEAIKITLCFKRYMHDPQKKMIQT